MILLTDLSYWLPLYASFITTFCLLILLLPVYPFFLNADPSHQFIVLTDSLYLLHHCLLLSLFITNPPTPFFLISMLTFQPYHPLNFPSLHSFPPAHHYITNNSPLLCSSSTSAGFLSTGDANSPGNYGLMDMAMALQWVYTNIRFFNGDRDKITVFGPGAGGAMAGLLAVLPRTKDWVSQVVAQVCILVEIAYLYMNMHTYTYY